MAGGSTSEEMDALDFDDVTPPKPVSIYDLDENLPTRMQSSEEIAEFQRKAREKRETAFKSFPAPNESGRSSSSGVSVRPVPRESGPVLIDRLRVPPPIQGEGSIEGDADADLDEVLNDVAASLARLPPAPRVPVFDEPRGSLETVTHQLPPSPKLAAPPPSRTRRWLIAAISVLTVGIVALGVFAAFFR